MAERDESCSCKVQEEEGGTLKGIIASAVLLVLAVIDSKARVLQPFLIDVLGASSSRLSTGGAAGLSASIIGDADAFLCALLCLASYLIAGKRVVLDAVKNILLGRVFDEEFLMTIASLGAAVVGEYPEAAAVMVLYQVGEYFEEKAEDRSRCSIAKLMSIRSDTASVRRGSEVVTVEADEVEVGETIQVLTGERIPIDGIVIKGRSFLDMAALTGESVPVRVFEGSEVSSGAINSAGEEGGGLLEIKTVRRAGQSAAARIVELVSQSAERKAHSEKFITSFSRIYTPVVCALALLLAVVPSFVTGQWHTWVYRALIFLVVSCPCALVISVPLAFYAGIGRASRMGILIKGGEFIETLSRTKIAVFDKTGTLTRGTFAVTDVHVAKGARFPSFDGHYGCGIDGGSPYGNGAAVGGHKLMTDNGVSVDDVSLNGEGADGASLGNVSAGGATEHTMTEDELVAIAAHAETYSSHPLSRSIRNAHSCPRCSLVKIEQAQEFAGMGIATVIDGVSILAGNDKLMRSRAVAGYAPCPLNDAGTVVHVAVDGVYAGHIVISDETKSDARDAITRLRREGVQRVVMLTGDNDEAAEAVARQTGVDEVKSRLLPADKVKEVERLLAELRGGGKARVLETSGSEETGRGNGTKRGGTAKRGSGDKRGTLLFAGDGINDAPSLTLADSGVAMGGVGSDAALEAADVVIMTDEISRVADAVQGAKATMRIVRENIVLSLGVKIAIMTLGALGAANMWLAVFGDTGVALLATANALRLQWKKDK